MEEKRTAVYNDGITAVSEVPRKESEGDREWKQWKTLRLAGSGGTYHWFPRTIRFMSKIKDKYDFAALNTHHFPFERLEEAMDMAANHKDVARKVMLTFGLD